MSPKNIRQKMIAIRGNSKWRPNRRPIDAQSTLNDKQTHDGTCPGDHGCDRTGHGLRNYSVFRRRGRAEVVIIIPAGALTCCFLPGLWQV